MTKGAQARVPNGLYTAWVIVTPAEHLPGTWVAHALEFDVVTQGSSAEDALRMVVEALGITLTDDLQEGLDPFRRRAPAECWQQLRQMMEHGERIDGDALGAKIRESRFDALAVMMWLQLRQVPVDATEGVRKPYDAPFAIASHAATDAHPC
jgi:predicted RNase H-like HicB family nuclease